MNPIVTIYIVNTNYGKYLKSSIDSALSQTYRRLEIILIDNASTDSETKDILETYDTDSRLSIYRLSKRRQLSAVNNIALRLTSGRYIVRLDADDILHHRAIEILAGQLDANPDAAVAYGSYYLMTETGKPTRKIQLTTSTHSNQFGDIPCHGACSLFRVAAIQSVGGYDESFFMQDGYEIWLKLRHEYQQVVVPNIIFYYRQHQRSLSYDHDRLLQVRSQVLDRRRILENLDHPSSIAVIPVRGSSIDPNSQPLRTLDGVPLVDWTIQKCLSLHIFKEIIVTTSDEGLLDYLRLKYDSNVTLVQRPPLFGSLGSSIDKTISHALENYPIDLIFTFAIEYPFLSSHLILSALNTYTLYSCDSLVSVYPDNGLFFSHDGVSLERVNPTIEARYERPSLYRQVPALTITSFDSFKKTKTLVNGNLGHVTLDRISSVCVQSDHEFAYANFLIESDESFSHRIT